MYFTHAPQIWQDYSQLVPGLLVVEKIQPTVEVENRLQPWYARARARLQQGPESSMPEIAAWRRAYAQMGLKPTKYRSAGEALLRRFKRENDLPRLHPLVDLCNAISLAFALPVAVFDLAGFEQYLEVRYAAGEERYLAFSGEIETPPPSEVIFADAANEVHARRWTFRQSRRSVVETGTRDVLIISEGVHEQAGRDVAALLDELGAAIGSLWGDPQKRMILSSRNPRMDFDI